MTLKDIALKSLVRQIGKKTFVLVAMALGCAAVIVLFNFISTQRKSLDSQFDEYGANIVILPKSDNLSLSYGGINVSGVITNMEELTLGDLEKIWEIPNKENIRAVSPKILGAVNVHSEETVKNVLLAGVYFHEEMKIKTWWEINGDKPTSTGEVILGSDAADKLGISHGDVIEIGTTSLTATGILAPTGSQDDSIIFTDFDLASTLLDKTGVASLAEVSALCSDCPIDQITAQLSTALPNANIKEIQQVMKQKMQSIGQFERFALSMTVVIVFICASLIFTSMMGSVSERKREIGIFSAVGFKSSHIITIILTEAFSLSIISGVIGTALGFGISRVLLPILLNISKQSLLLDSKLMGSSIPVVVLLGLLSALYPAIKASKIDPVSTMNSL